MHNPGRSASDEELWALEVDGYRPPRQHRASETTRRLVACGWELMADHPDRPLRLEDLLAATGVSTSSFYARFDHLASLVEVAGLLALAADARRTPPGPAPTRAIALDHATRCTWAPILVPTHLPREVLVVGVWRAHYVAARSAARTRRIHELALTVAGDGEAPGDATVRTGRVVTWLHLSAATADLLWAIGLPPLGIDRLVGAAGTASALGARLLDVTAPPGPVGALALLPSARRASPPGPFHRSARAAAELRPAIRAALVQEGLAITTGAVARSVHRSRGSFADAFGTLDRALADLARAEQVARIPTELLRPRDDVPPAELVAHLVRRIRRWQDQKGVVGRRLLQSAGSHPELAAEVMGQLLDSAELLTGWYAASFAVLDEDLVRLVFVMLLAHELHRVLWGAVPDALGGPAAVAALLQPMVTGA